MRSGWPKALFLSLAALTGATGGCATFSNVRSAEVKEGFAVSLQYTGLWETGDEAGYFWAAGDLGDCRPCSPEVYTLDLSGRYGIRPGGRGYAFEVGAGMAGLTQWYVEGFAGLGQGGRVPFGIGFRVPVRAMDEEAAGKDYRVDGRIDWRVSESVRLVANPGWYYHVEGWKDRRSWFSAFVPGVGVELSTPHVSVTPSVAWIRGRGKRRDMVADELGLHDVRLSAPTFAVTITVHGRQE